MNFPEFKAKYAGYPETVLKVVEDWQHIALREASEMLGSPEGESKLAEARRYEFMRAAYEHILKGEK